MIEPTVPQLYVYQREFAAVPTDRSLLLGSDSATTCHILIALSARVAFCAHLDGAPGQMQALREALEDTFGRDHFEVHIAGGFLDERNLSEGLSQAVVNVLEKFACAVRFRCVGLKNTRFDPVPAPRVRALAVQLPERKILVNEWFHSKGPDWRLRSAFAMSGCWPLIRTGTTRPEFIFPWPMKELDRLLTLDDAALLQEMSTSPAVEHPSFCDEMRETLRFMKSLVSG